MAKNTHNAPWEGDVVFIDGCLHGANIPMFIVYYLNIFINIIGQNFKLLIENCTISVV